MKTKTSSKNIFFLLFAALFCAHSALAANSHKADYELDDDYYDNPHEHVKEREKEKIREREKEHRRLARGENIAEYKGHAMNIEEMREIVPDIKIQVERSTGRVYLAGRIPTECKGFFEIVAVRPTEGRKAGFRVTDIEGRGRACMKPYRGKVCKDARKCTSLSVIPAANFYLAVDDVRDMEFAFHIGGTGANARWSVEGEIPVNFIHREEESRLAHNHSTRYDDDRYDDDRWDDDDWDRDSRRTHSSHASGRPVIVEDIYLLGNNQANSHCSACAGGARVAQAARPQLIRVPANGAGGCSACNGGGARLPQIPVRPMPQLIPYPGNFAGNNGGFCPSCQARPPLYPPMQQRMPLLLPPQQQRYPMPYPMPMAMNGGGGCQSCQQQRPMPYPIQAPYPVMAPNYLQSPYILNGQQNQNSFQLGFRWS